MPYTAKYSPLPISRHDTDSRSLTPRTNIIIRCVFSFYECLQNGCRGIYQWIFPTKVYKYENEIMELQTMKERLDKRVQDYAMEIEKLKEDNEEYLKRIEKLENDLKTSEIANSRLHEHVRDLQKSNLLLAKNYEQEKEEKEKALTRLSSVAGDRLRFNNPAIADLSDENRPNKLAEKFSELYDNEWTEFYENLEDTGSEEEIIGQIVQLLEDAFNTCNRLAENQRRLLTNVIECPANQIPNKTFSPPEAVLSKVIDFQKRNATAAFKNVEKEILEKCAPLKENNSKAKYRFVERCSQLCWMMAIQDPPMFLDFGPNKDSVIDKNVFRLYTKSGEKVDFVVWPAVFLHQNGPIVQKGVLQPQ